MRAAPPPGRRSAADALVRRMPRPRSRDRSREQIAGVNLALPSTFDPGTPFVLEAVVSGNTVTCTASVDGLGVVGTLTTALLGRLNGSFGLKTWDTAAEFHYFRVYAR